MTTLKSKLLGDGHAFAPKLMEFFSPGMPAVIAAIGADFALFDMKHTGASLETMKVIVAGCRGLGLAPQGRVQRFHFVRDAKTDHVRIVEPKTKPSEKVSDRT